MKEICNLEEQQLWNTCFPHFAPYAQKRGAYIIRPQETILKELQAGMGLEDPCMQAAVRLELACSGLWPQVSDLFLCDFFPHLLAASTDILRAVGFGEEAPPERAALVQELVDALNNCETVLATADSAVAKASEPKEEQ